MAKTTISQKDADAIIAEVASLLKADPGKETSGESTPEGSSTAPADASPPPSGDAGGPPSGPSDGPPADASAGGPPDGGMDPGGDASPEQLRSEIENMDPQEFQMWFQIFQDVAASKAGGDAGGDPSMSGDPSMGPGADAPPPAGDASAGGPPTMKKEFSSPGNGGMAKSERDYVYAELARLGELSKALGARDAEIKTLKDEVASLKKNEEAFGQAAEAMTRVVTREGVRSKAVKTVSQIAKPGTDLAKGEKPDVAKMSRSDILKAIAPMAKSEKTSRDDCNAILKYSADPGADPAIVAHLVVQ